MRIRNIYLAGAFGAALMAAAAIGWQGVAGARALAAGQQNEAQIEAIVRQYILDHPEVLVESLNTFMRDQQLAQISQYRSAALGMRAELTSLAGGFAIGAEPQDAQVTIVELFDYHCSYCKRVAGELLETVRGRDDVRLVYKEFPILKEESETASLAALAARAHGDYVKFHQAMMKTGGTLTDSRIDQIARDAGVDVAAMRRGMNDPLLKHALADTYERAASLGVNGTPSFVIFTGGKAEIIVGANLPRVKEIIASGEIDDVASQPQQGPSSPAGQ